MSTPEPAGPKPPRPPRTRLGELRPLETAESNGEEDLDGVEICGLQAESLEWTGHRQFISSQMSSARVESWAATGASLTGSVISESEILALSSPDSGWWNVEIRDSRLGSAELPGATLRNVAFVRCKLGYANLRGATLNDVAFVDCVITDLDLSMAQAKRVAFSGCRIERLDCANGTLADFDLRGAALTDVGSVSALRGASITIEQLLDLAPAMALQLGIRLD